MNLLVVDDDHRMRKMLRVYFEFRGWQVSCAEDVEGARAFLEKGQFDTIITDINMPGGSGMDLLRQVKDADSLAQVILITGYRDLNYAIDAVNEGAFAYLEKPFQLDDLHERVLEALEVKYRAEEAEEERRNLANLVGIREEEISLLKERSQAILSVFPSLLVLVNHESRIRDVNERFLKVFNGRKRKKLGLLICDALRCPLYEGGPCPEPCDLWNALQSTIATDKPSDRLTTTPPFGGLPYPDRPTFQVRILPLPALSPDGAKDREFLVIMEDISRERAMEMQVLHSSRLASLGEMATGIAHELSQPLNVISTQTQLMRFKLERDGEISEDALCSTVDETMEQVFRMSDILQHLRVYGRRQAATGYSEFTSQELLEGSLKLTHAQFKAWGIELVVKSQEPQFKIGGKLHELQHALTNVLLNARDALREKRSALADNSPGDRRLEIRVHLRSFMREGAPWVGIDISDNGTGIHPTALERIFDPMFTTKADGEGSGLGLPIAAAILREHGGSVRIESELDRGTSVFFEIPALNPEESNH